MTPKQIITLCKTHPAKFRELDYSQSNWIKDFGADLTVKSPVGLIKIGENQFEKLKSNNRESFIGLIKPTITNPDFVLYEKTGAIVFVKVFIKSDKTVWWVSVSYEIDGLTVVISSHQKREKEIQNKIAQGHLLFKSTALESATSDTPTQSPRSGRKSKSKGKKPARKNANPAVDEAEKAFETFMQYPVTRISSINIPIEKGLAFIGTCSRIDYFSDKMIFKTDQKTGKAKVREYTHDFTEGREPKMYLTADRKSIVIVMEIPATHRGIEQ